MSRLTAAEELALLELFAAVSVVFDEEPFSSAKALAMSMRRIQKPYLKCRTVFASTPVIGRGEPDGAA